MQIDFHYYATNCAAFLAGYSYGEALNLCSSAQFVDCCSRTYLQEVKASPEAATTQLNTELMNHRTDLVGLQEITRIWTSFHFLPYDLCADTPRRTTAAYRNKFRLIAGPDGALVKDTVELAKGKGTEAAGLAMHVLADTWAHRYFAGTPSLVINNTNYHFFELLKGGEAEVWRAVKFRHSASQSDDLQQGLYVNTMYRAREHSVMNLGHGRAGHLPDYSFMIYRYLPAWAGYAEIVKDNPADYYRAFCQMIYAMKYLRGVNECFVTEQYDTEAAKPFEEEIHRILKERRADASADWKALGERMWGREIPEFREKTFAEEYRSAAPEEKQDTFLGRFIQAALSQKSMVAGKIYASGNLLAGVAGVRPGKGKQ